MSAAEHTSNQRAINQKEWEDPENWSTIYFSKRDTRAMVPKRNPKLGWTVNFGHPLGGKSIYAIFLLLFIVGFIVGYGYGMPAQ